jgi:uncharacterized membrane protein
LFWSAILSLTPISELRGAIPYAVANGMPLFLAALWCVAWNALAGPIAYVFLSTVHRLLYRWKAYASFFDRVVGRARAKVHASVEKYGYWGIVLFVGVPLPLTGAWTGALGAWILGMDRKKAMLAAAAGVLMAGGIVTLVVGLGVGALSLFTKTV